MGGRLPPITVGAPPLPNLSNRARTNNAPEGISNAAWSTNACHAVSAEAELPQPAYGSGLWPLSTDASSWRSCTICAARRPASQRPLIRACVLDDRKRHSATEAARHGATEAARSFL